MFTINRKYDDVIKKVCDRHGVDSDLVKAIIKKESNFDGHCPDFILTPSGQQEKCPLGHQNGLYFRLRTSLIG